MKWLLQNDGCSIDERNKIFNSCILLGHLEIVKWLIENGCSFHDSNYGVYGWVVLF